MEGRGHDENEAPAQRGTGRRWATRHASIYYIFLCNESLSQTGDRDATANRSAQHKACTATLRITIHQSGVHGFRQTF